MTTIIDIDLADGRTVSGRADFGKGSPLNPMTDEELAAKFLECAAWGGLAKQNAEKIVDVVFGLEKLSSIRELTRTLAAGGAASAKRRETARTKVRAKAKRRPTRSSPKSQTAKRAVRAPRQMSRKK